MACYYSFALTVISVLIVFSIHRYAVIFADHLPPYKSAVNWGVNFVNVPPIVNGIQEYKHTIAIPIPAVDFTSVAVQPQCNTDILKELQCELMQQESERADTELRSAYIKLEQDLTFVLQTIPPLSTTKSAHAYYRRRRQATFDASVAHLRPDFCETGADSGGGGGLLHGIGRLQSDLFGYVTSDDLKVADRHICILADADQLNADQIRKTADDFASVSNVLNQRIDNFYRLANNTRLRINEMQERFRVLANNITKNQNDLWNRLTITQHALLAMQTYLLDLGFIRSQHKHYIHEVEKWIDGVTVMQNGFVPKHLVPVDIMDNILEHIKQNVLGKFHDLTFITDNRQFYYEYKQITYTRTDSHIYLTITIPLQSVSGLMWTYRVDQTYLASTQDHKSSTRITNLPSYISFRKDLQYFTEFERPNDYLSWDGRLFKKSRSSTKILRRINEPTCAAALFVGNVSGIREKCKLELYDDASPTHAHDIGNHTFQVHSELYGSDHTWTLRCRDTVRQIPSCNSCQIKVPCGCLLDMVSMLIPTQYTDCDMDDPVQTDVKQTLTNNFHILSQFTHLQLYNDVTLDQIPQINKTYLRNFTFENSNYAENIAEDQRIRLNLTKYLALIKNGTKTYRSKADYVAAQNENFYLKSASVGQSIQELLRDSGGLTTPVAVWSTTGCSIFFSCAALIMVVLTKCS